MISLIHPSRGRPQKAFNTAKKWIENAGCEIEYILSIDLTDPELLQYGQINNAIIQLHNPDIFIKDNLKMIYKLNHSVVEATNKAAKISTGDILLYLSDDFDCFPDWGLAVQKEFENENRPLLIKVDDCLQKFDVPVLTIPIMNRALYERLGYFWFPGYKSMFVDEDLYWTTKKLGALKMCPHLKFSHNHVSVGKAENDETYKRSALNWDQGKALFNSRKSQGFPL